MRDFRLFSLEKRRLRGDQPPCCGLPRASSDLALNALGCPWMGHPQLLWQPVPVPHHPLSKEFLPNVEHIFPLLVFKAILPCPIPIRLHKQSFPFLPIGSFQVLEGHNEVTPVPSLLQAKQAWLPQPFMGEVKWWSPHFPIPGGI